MTQVLAMGAIGILALVGLLASNLLFDRGVDAAFSRRVPGVLGGVGFLIAVLWLGPWSATALAGVLTALILVLRLRFRKGLRGITGSMSTQAWAEISYPLAGTLGLAVGWGLLDDRWLAFVPIAFMAWGDSASGITRDIVVRRGIFPGVWPSVAMLGACFASAAMFQPFWIGAIGALAATGAERYSPMSPRVRDDSWTIVAASLGVMGTVVYLGF